MKDLNESINENCLRKPSYFNLGFLKDLTFPFRSVTSFANYESCTFGVFCMLILCSFIEKHNIKLNYRYGFNLFLQFLIPNLTKQIIGH